MLYAKKSARKRRMWWMIGIAVVAGYAWYMGYRIPHITRLSDQCVANCIYPFLQLQRPVVATLDRIRTYRMTMHDLRKRVAELEATKEQLTAELVQLYATQRDEPLARELAALREAYAFPDAIGAHVMMKIFSENEHAVLVDAGERAGIEVGMVAVWNNSIVGRVAYVYPWYSKVVLISDRSCKIAAYCAKTGTQCIHEGTADTHKTQLTHIEHYNTLEEGDLVISSGQGLIFPQGFALGRIQSYAQDGLWINASVEPIVALNSLDYCVLFHKGQRVGEPPLGQEVISQ